MSEELEKICRNEEVNGVGCVDVMVFRGSGHFLGGFWNFLILNRFK
jgi:hypothetical protein